MENVILRTERVEMKFPCDFICAEDVVRAIGNEETVRYMDSVPKMEYTKENALSFLRFLEYTRTRDNQLQLGIFKNETGQYIGMCTLENIDRQNESCELGYWLNKNYTGKGIMTECAATLIKYAKDELKMKTINAYVIVDHIKSRALLERLGFEQKELMKDNTENKGKLVDRYHYELKL